MSEVIDEKELLRLNPHIDRKKLKESILISQQLANSGVKMSEYRLASPFSRRRIRKQADSYANTKRTRKYRGL